MSEFDLLIDRYEQICTEHNVEPHCLVTKVLKVEKDLWDGLQSSVQLYLAGNNKLITKTRLDDKQMEILFEWLKNNPFVTSLDLRYNNITDKGAVHVAKLIEETPGLMNLNLMGNDFGEEGAKHLAKALQTNETLTSIKLTGNKIGNKGAMYFAQALQVNTHLEALDLAETDLKAECIIALATVLNYNNTLKALNVNRPILRSEQEETTVHFADMLKVNKNLQELHLMNYNMKDFGVTRLAEKLVDNFYLTHLNLSCNRITRDGARELSTLLKRNTPLKVLDLGYNRLGDPGLLHLAEAIATYNTHLTTLVVVSNEASSAGLCALAASLRINSTLTNLYIWGNTLEEPVSIAFSALLDSGRLLEQNIDVKPYKVDGTTYLSELNHGIRKWYYWGPYYGEQARPELARFTKQQFKDLWEDI